MLHHVKCQWSLVNWQHEVRWEMANGVRVSWSIFPIGPLSSALECRLSSRLELEIFTAFVCGIFWNLLLKVFSRQLLFCLPSCIVVSINNWTRIRCDLESAKINSLAVPLCHAGKVCYMSVTHDHVLLCCQACVSSIGSSWGQKRANC